MGRYVTWKTMPRMKLTVPFCRGSLLSAHIMRGHCVEANAVSVAPLKVSPHRQELSQENISAYQVWRQAPAHGPVLCISWSSTDAIESKKKIFRGTETWLIPSEDALT
jgi:hypothetical protein